MDAGIASAAKVAVVTNTLVYLRIFNINDSDPIRTNEQVHISSFPTHHVMAKKWWSSRRLIRWRCLQL